MEFAYKQWKNLTPEQKVEMLGMQMLEFGICQDRSGIELLHCKVCGILGYYDEDPNEFFPGQFCFCNTCEKYSCEKCINVERYEKTDNCDSCEKI